MFAAGIDSHRTQMRVVPQSKEFNPHIKFLLMIPEA